MSIRVVNGNDHTEDGWPLVDQAGCTWITVPGTNPPVSLQIQSGQPLILLRAWAADWNAYIEPLRDADSACWTEGNSVLGQPGKNNGSNHLGGTAIDLNWSSHPFRQRGSLNAAQMRVMEEMETFYEGTVFWAGRWDDPADEMHSQCGYNTYNNPHTGDFIARKIRADGFSTFRRGNAPATPLAAQVLSDATGLDLARASEILPTVTSGLQAAQCNNVNRIAMWLAQCGEESAGFSTTEEFASGAEYEGRCSDLGNCSPGDGVKYKGRTWIQITGKAHYREFSEWAFSKGLISSPTQFVDNPTSLGDLSWAGIGAAWYWTVSRPDINELSDAGDVVTVTHRINGGEHGLADRQRRYSRAHALDGRLLALLTAGPPPPPPPPPPPVEEGFLMALSDQEQRALYNEIMGARPSRSPLRHLGERTLGDAVDALLNTDGSVHVLVVKELAKLGHPEILALLRDVAAADPVQYPDRQQDRLLAQAMLADVTSGATAAPSAIAYPAPVYQPPLPAISTNGKDRDTGAVIADLYRALDRLHLADALPIEARAPLAALISVLQTKNGSQV